MCVCEYTKQRQKEGANGSGCERVCQWVRVSVCTCLWVCVCACVCVRESERSRETESAQIESIDTFSRETLVVNVRVCACVCVRKSIGAR